MQTPLMKAIALGDDPEALLDRLRETADFLESRLGTLFRPIKKCRFDFENKRLYSIEEELYLQWQLRCKPDEPISYRNQQTNRGVVYLRLSRELV